jgi:hypothetical protein
MLGLQAQSLYTIHQGQTGGRGLSPRLWSNAVGQGLSPDGFSNGILFYDDFLNTGALTLSGTIGYGTYGDTGATIANIATASGGVLRLATDNSDNDEVSISQGGIVGAGWKIDTASGQDKMLIFEARFKLTAVSARNVFVGLAEEGLAVTTGLFSNANPPVIQDKDFIGFYILEGTPTTLRFSYQKASTTGDYTDHDFIVSSSVAADTWYKVGFIYDPKATPSEAIRVFLDNDQCATTIPRSDIVDSAGVAVAVFPNGEELTAMFNSKNGGAVAQNLDIDWVAVFQNG